MSTPTEPTTPQPKPADAAGLLPLRAHGRYIRDCNDWAIADAYTEANALLLVKMLNRPLPTPHAAEAGQDLAEILPATYYADRPLAERLRLLVQHWQKLVVICNDLPAEAGVREIAREIANNHMIATSAGKERVDRIAAILARHRNAAETVGTGWMPIETAPKDGNFIPVRWKYMRKGSVVCYTKAAFQGDRWVCEDLSVCYPEEWLSATPPATQSALEQAREALEWCLVKVPSPCRCVHFATPPHICVAHTALNAVLQPAEGGAEG